MARTVNKKATGATSKTKAKTKTATQRAMEGKRRLYDSRVLQHDTHARAQKSRTQAQSVAKAMNEAIAKEKQAAATKRSMEGKRRLYDSRVLQHDTAARAKKRRDQAQRVAKAMNEAKKKTSKK